MSEAMEEIGAAPSAPSLSMWQMAALASLARLAGDGECERPKGTQFTTLQALQGLGLVAGRVADRPRSNRFRKRGLAPTLWRVTPAGRAALASADPAGAVRQVARKQLYDKLVKGGAA